MFKGFSPETIDFLWGIRFNNEKSWFDAHKECYQAKLYPPMKELAKEVSEPFLQIPGMVCRVSRIYRDARRIYNGKPYKESLWMSLRVASPDWGQQPNLFFEITPDGYDYGFIWWAPKADVMQAFRTRLEDQPDKFLKIVKKAEQETGIPVTGREYYRKKSCPNPKIEAYYNLKNMQAYVEKPVDDLLFQPELVSTVRQTLQSLLPLYQYCQNLTV